MGQRWRGRALQVDADEFTVFYREYHHRVVAYCLRRASRDEGRDAADETFFIAWRRRNDIPASALPWLLVIARNILADRHRRNLRHVAITAELAACSESVQRGADHSVVERTTVLRALASLSDLDREVLMLVVWDGLAAKDAAKVAGCSSATFTVRLHRARRRLAAALRTSEQDEAVQPAGTTPATAARLAGAHLSAPCKEES